MRRRRAAFRRSRSRAGVAPAAYLTDAQFINASGAIPVNSFGGDIIVTQDFFYSHGVSTEIAPLSAFVAALTGMNRRDVVVGDYATGSFASPSYNSAVIATRSVPEPAEWTILLVGFGGLGLRLRGWRGVNAATRRGTDVVGDGARSLAAESDQ